MKKKPGELRTCELCQYRMFYNWLELEREHRDLILDFIHFLIERSRNVHRTTKPTALDTAEA
uniref:Uncharacterized protein n=1 Tax=viral metagenome TaxID=1070528 RepID=A0A6M3L349_9ZZZZ